MKQASGFIMRWVKREANGLVHTVAKKALKGILPVNWVASPPSFVISVLARELFPVLWP